ncbi:MAG: enoyl-CoA hydratase/isomerase family protein [Candidatus Saccharibacteria bacterium]
MNEYKTILLSRDDKIAVLTINRPQQFNLVNVEYLKELDAAAQELRGIDDLGAVVINANGEHFSAGIDLNMLAGVDSQFVMKHLDWLQHVYGQWESFPVPVIAAIHGLCYGSATELILACDIRVAASNARIAIPEVRFGLSPDMGGTTRLTKLVGPGQAKRLIIACEEIDAEEAKAIGLVEIVVEPDQLMERAVKLAKRIAGMPPVAVKMAKKGINLAVESSRMASLHFEYAQSTYCCGTEDQKEAIASFFEKRKPVFKGK